MTKKKDCTACRMISEGVKFRKAPKHTCEKKVSFDEIEDGPQEVRDKFWKDVSKGIHDDVHRDMNEKGIPLSYMKDGHIIIEHHDGVKEVYPTGAKIPNLRRITDLGLKHINVRSDYYWLLVFYSDNCAFCHPYLEAVEEVSTQAKHIVLFQKANIKDCPEAPFTHEIRQVPCTVLMKGKEVVEKFYGFKNVENLLTFLNRYANQ